MTTTVGSRAEPTPAPLGAHPELGAVDALVDRIVAHQPAVGLAIGVVRDGRLAYFRGHGRADVASATPITRGTVFRIASISKTFTAVALMQLWEQGLVHLDAPVGEYLTSYRLSARDPGWRPPTLRHLLTHTAGLGELAHPSGLFRPDFGESFRLGVPLPSLAEFYGGELLVHAEPGTRFIYNNHGPSTVGQVVEDVSGVPLGDYFRRQIFDELGMGDSDLVRSERVAERLATGYEIRSRRVAAVEERELVTAGAASVYSTPEDMARYLSALLPGGHGRTGAVLGAKTLELMFEPHYQPDPRLPGMGLGFFRYSVGGRVVAGHQGTLPGFHSQIMLDPRSRVGVMAFTNGAHRPDFWLPAVVASLLEVATGTAGDSAPPDVEHHPELWNDLVGWYRLSARLSDIRLRAMMGAGAEVFVRRGRLMLRMLGPVPAMAAGFPLQPDAVDDPYLFRVDLPGEMTEPVRIAFSQGSDGRTRRMHLDLMPLALRKQGGATNPRRWVAGVGLGGAALALGRARRRRPGRTSS